MNAPGPHPRIIVGVDGSEASVAALRVARAMAEPMSAKVEAWACWDVPAGYGVYLAVGIEGFKYAAEQVLNQALAEAFEEVPPFVHPRLVRGKPGPALIDASRNASLLIVGRRGHGSFVPGSVSSACVSHAHCPVLVVHSPETEAPETETRTEAAAEEVGGAHPRSAVVP
ncbi:nucleotide-binding universal stress UspA family protein [Arthrobacter sp. SLBN-83]|uniref:universal stress protein n=1 Tax=Arthrobacter sp. SLBN-83 TaxID=2768449 RepID=UPI0011504633|nr:universal stress protein [Arthrobacter sp. SLBN-83]TQJ61040.1 nucleotide-binding universal stress UspA family protein [Arthrobacter sp. SLBN-83]